MRESIQPLVRIDGNQLGGVKERLFMFRFSGHCTGIFLLAIVWCLASCGGGSGGGGGGGGFGIGGSGFGFDDNFGNTTAPPTAGDFPVLIGLNLPVILYFNEDIDPATCSNLSINVVTIDDPEGQAQYGAGHSASVDFNVFGSELHIHPKTFFAPDNVTYGFLQNAVYEIRFQLPPAVHIVTSVSGRTITINDAGSPVAFRTNEDVYDLDGLSQYPYPRPIRFSLMEENPPGVWTETYGELYENWVEPTIPAYIVNPGCSTTPKIRIDFKIGNDGEHVRPETVVNFADNSSPSLSILYYADPPFNSDRVKALGKWYLTQSENESYVEFEFDIISLLPTEDTLPPPQFPDDYAKYFIEVKGNVEDLSGMTKIEWENDIGAKDEVALYTDIDPGIVLPPIEETFVSSEYEDIDVTSGIWGAYYVPPLPEQPFYFLGPGLGGGTGDDGPFLPPSDLPPEAFIPGGTQVVELPTEIGGVQREYNFTSFRLPYGWTLRLGDGSLPGGAYSKPLVIKATGSIRIDGTVLMTAFVGSLDVMDGADASYGGWIGTAGGTGVAGGGSGGDGGSVANGLPVPFYDVAGYEPYNNDNFGITGVSTALADYVLQDTSKTTPEYQAVKNYLDTVVTPSGNKLLLQPNVGMGPGNGDVVTNHPTFVVKDVDPATKTISVIDNILDPYYRGSMLQPSTNPGFPVPPPIAETGDPYILGILRGIDGTEPVGMMSRQGLGSGPLTVAQTSTTYASAGGGGGGGGSAPDQTNPPSTPGVGETGQTGPDFPPVGGNVGGFSTPYCLGADGGSKSGPTGDVLSRIDPLNLQLADNYLGAPNDQYVGYRIGLIGLNPDKEKDGWLFTITANTSNTVTIQALYNGKENFDHDRFHLRRRRNVPDLFTR